MPAHYRCTGVRSAWADVNQGGRLADSFLEGPVFDGAGNLFVTDIPFGRVLRIDPKGAWDLVAQWDGEPTGRVYRLGADGRLDLLVSNVPSPRKSSRVRLERQSPTWPLAGPIGKRCIAPTRPTARS